MTTDALSTPERFTGGCHCRRVTFAVTVKSLKASDCNCSICEKKGFLHVIVEKSALEILSGADALTTYTFNTKTAKHTFCTTCGIHPFYVPRSHPDGYSVNLRCFDDPDARARFSITPFDGRHWEDSVDAIR